MTNENAIKHLEVIKGECALVGDIRALDMAISALSENKTFEGMTNGEVFDSIIDVDNDCEEVHGENGLMWFAFSQDWWNAPYKAEREG